MSAQLIEVPKVPDVGRSWLGSTRVTRTNALPKQSLFGTTLQQKEGNVIEGIRNVNLKQEDGAKSSRSTKSKILSAELEAIFGEGEQILEHSKQQLLERKMQISRAEELLHAVEEKAKYFKLESTQVPREEKWERSKGNQKMTASDLYHASDINNIGLHQGSYNHQKYGRKPPVHQYSMSGDPLRKGNTGPDHTPITDKPNHMIPRIQPFKRHRDPYSVPKEAYMRHTPDTVLPGTDVTIPANIRHKYGTIICKQLLADPEKVKYCISRQEEAMLRETKPTKAKETFTLPPQQLDPAYDEIGTATRANIFGPGITRNHKIGTMKEDFSDLVYKRRVPETDAYRYQRDELSTWAEQNVLRERVKKAWELSLEHKK